MWETVVFYICPLQSFYFRIISDRFCSTLSVSFFCSTLPHNPARRAQFVFRHKGELRLSFCDVTVPASLDGVRVVVWECLLLYSGVELEDAFCVGTVPCGYKVCGYTADTCNFNIFLAIFSATEKYHGKYAILARKIRIFTTY